jgi:hypothetical protein
MTIPKITDAHWKQAFTDLLSPQMNNAAICNRAIEIALAEQQEREYITAAQARELGSGNAEYSINEVDWYTCKVTCEYRTNAVFSYRPYKYRAIKQPHAALRAEYAKQVEEGTTGFYLWEYMNPMCDFWRTCIVDPSWNPDKQYRCTDISCYVAKQGEPAKRMLRTEAQELQRQTDETHEWRLPNGSYRNEVYANGKLTFTDKGTYTYAPKALKQVKWSDMPVGVAVQDTTTNVVWTYQGSAVGEDALVTQPQSRPFGMRWIILQNLTLAPASEQPWIAVQDTGTLEFFQRELISKGLNVSGSFGRIKVTGIAEGYVLEGAV